MNAGIRDYSNYNLLMYLFANKRLNESIYQVQLLRGKYIHPKERAYNISYYLGMQFVGQTGCG